MMQKNKTLLYSIFFSLLLAIFTFSSCGPAGRDPQGRIKEPAAIGEKENIPEWSGQHLRLIDAVDMKNPADDIIAIYSKEEAKQFIIRVDYLSLDKTDPDGLLVALDFTGGGSKKISENIQSDIAWDILFSGESNELTFFDHAVTRKEKVKQTYMVSDHDLDAIFISFPKNLIDDTDLSSLRIQVFSAGANPSDRVWDQTSSFDFHGDPPRQRAPLLLIFWNSFDAQTPAQALRLWNGAHTGPIGQRHGLFHLLTAVETHQVPVTILDIKKPAPLAALSFMEQIDWIRTLEQKGLIALPTAAYGDPDANATSLGYSLKSTSSYDLKNTTLAFGPFKDLGYLDEHNTIFAFLNKPDHIYSNSRKRIIPLPMPFYLSSDTIDSQLQHEILDENGLTNQAKTQLIQSALSNDKSQINIFGGNLKNGLWAAQYISDDVFKYIANHPWIMPLSEEDLLSWKAQKIDNVFSGDCSDILCSPQFPDLNPVLNSKDPETVNYSYSELKEIVKESLLSLPDNPITDSAWAMYLMLTTPSTSTDRLSLQANYLGSTGHLIEAAKWYQNPSGLTTTTCCEDIDWDGEVECVMYNQNFFATFEREGGVLHSAFTKTAEGVSQVFGPSSQFTIGTGDQKNWELSMGLEADPLHLPGAFFGKSDKSMLFNVTNLPDSLLFTTQSIQKTYRLQNQQLTIQINSNSPQTIFLTIPNSNHWSEYPVQSNLAIMENGPESFKFVINDNNLHMVTGLIEDCLELTTTSYANSYPYISQPEDPNQIFSDGHYLPFPISILKIEGEQNLKIVVDFNHPK